MSKLLQLDSSLTSLTSDNFTIIYKNAIKLANGPWEIALVSANLWNSFFNIAAEFSNNKIAYTNNTPTKFIITIPGGLYTIEQLNDFLHLLDSLNHLVLLPTRNKALKRDNMFQLKVSLNLAFREVLILCI